MAQKRRRKSKKNDEGVALLITGLVVVALIWSAIQATHGLVLLIPVALVGFWMWRRVDRQQRARRERIEQAQQAAALEAHRRSIARDLDGLLRLSPYEFEHAVAAVLRGLGWTEVEVTKGSGDRGIDVVGIDPDGWRTVVQCKRYSYSPVGGPDVRNLAGARVQHGADRAMLVTTATFTKQAYEAAERTQIELMTGEDLVMLARTLEGTGHVLPSPVVPPVPPPGWTRISPVVPPPPPPTWPG